VVQGHNGSQGEQDYDDDDDDDNNNNELMNYFSGNTVILGRRL
jgi:hypothetical protein